VNYPRLARGARLTLTLVLTLAGNCRAVADQGLLGKWSDNAPRNTRIGDVEITESRIRLGNVTYRVKPAGRFGDGETFAVTGIDRKRDPQGCGPTGKVHFISAQPLPALEGTHQSAIRLFFFSGDKAPDPETIGKDPELCAAHPFGRD
jgi:hypothetical protein